MAKDSDSEKYKMWPNKIGLALGSFLAVVHLIWVIMVKIGVAAKFLDWIMGLHFISMPMAIMPFNIGNAVFLVVVTFIFGYVAGWLFSVIWHCVLHKHK